MESLQNVSYHHPILPYRVISGPESQQGSDEWLKFRKGKLGASMAATVMGVNPYQTRLQLWEEMISGISRVKVTAAMKRGTEQEPLARAWFSEQVDAMYRPIVIESTVYPLLIASLDGHVIDETGKMIGLEIKCPGKEVLDLADQGKIPEHYQWQMTHQMMVSGGDKWFYLAWDGTVGKVVPFYRDQEKVEALVKASLDFLNLVKQRLAPEEVERDVMHIFDPDKEKAALRYAELDEIIKKAEAERDKIRDDLVAFAKKTHPRIKLSDKLRIIRFFRKGAIEYGKIPQLQKVDLEYFRKPDIETWRVTVGDADAY